VSSRLRLSFPIAFPLGAGNRLIFPSAEKYKKPNNSMVTFLLFVTQRMIRCNPIFQHHVAEHPRLLLLIVSSHPCFLPHFSSAPTVAFSTSS
jgi:hypothetical protein